MRVLEELGEKNRRDRVRSLEEKKLVELKFSADNARTILSPAYTSLFKRPWPSDAPIRGYQDASQLLGIVRRTFSGPLIRRCTQNRVMVQRNRFSCMAANCIH